MISVRINSRCFALLISILIIGASMLRAQEPTCPKDGRPDCPRAHAFFHTVQAALTKNDRSALATMMEYPFLTRINNRKVHIATKTQFLRHFDQIFDNGVRCEILTARDDKVWGNSHGFTVGDGAIWFDALIPRGEKVDVGAPDYWSKYPFKIVTVNSGSDYPCARTSKTQK